MITLEKLSKEMKSRSDVIGITPKLLKELENIDKFVKGSSRRNVIDIPMIGVKGRRKKDVAIQLPKFKGEVGKLLGKILVVVE